MRFVDLHGVCALFLLGAFALGACASGSDTAPATTTGGACSSAASCGAGALCATSQDFPNGYCTRGCVLANPSSCPNGSVCIDDASGAPADAGVSAICYQSCQTDADCTQAGFKCLEKSSKRVCRSGK